MDDHGVITLASRFSAAETIDRMISAIAERGLTVFGRIDHADNAAKVGMPLRPTYLVIFGNPKGGTVLMQDRQRAGIDLPLKALVWEDAEGSVWLAYNEAQWIADRHGLGPHSTQAVQAISAVTVAVANEATGHG